MSAYLDTTAPENKYIEKNLFHYIALAYIIAICDFEWFTKDAMHKLLVYCIISSTSYLC